MVMGEIMEDYRMQCKSGHEMKDLGQWPSADFTSVVNKWHCVECDEHKSEPVSDSKLVLTGDGSFQQVSTKD